MTGPERSLARVRYALLHSFIVLSFVPVFYYNVIAPAGSYARPIDPNSAFARQVKGWLDRPIFRMISRLTGGATTWRMYSPVWKYFTWFEWYAKSPDGVWVPIETANLSPAYWVRRNWFRKTFQDCKEAMMTSEMNGREPYRRTLGHYMCRDAAKRFGWVPTTLRLVRNEKRIPPPEQFTGWSPLTSPITQQSQWDFACP